MKKKYSSSRKRRGGSSRKARGSYSRKPVSTRKRYSDTKVLTLDNRVVNTYKASSKPYDGRRLKQTASLVKRLQDFGAPQRVFNYVSCYTADSSYGYSRYFASLIGMGFYNSYYDNTLYRIAETLWSVSNAANRDKWGAAKLDLDNMHLRTVIRNVTPTPTGEGTNTWTGTVDIDVYTVVARKDVPVTEFAGAFEATLAAWKNVSRMAQALDGVNAVEGDGFTVSTAVQSAGVTLGTQAVGDSLFDNAEFCKHFKIIKVQKVMLPQGETFELNHHVAQDKTVAVNNIANNSYSQLTHSILKGVTQGYIFNINGRLYEKSTPPDNNFAYTKVQVETYTRYSVKPLRVNNVSSSLNYAATLT